MGKQKTRQTMLQSAGDCEKWNLQDTRAMRSADIGSDHHLLLAMVRISQQGKRNQKETELNTWTS